MIDNQSLVPIPGDEIFTPDVIRWCKKSAKRWRMISPEDAISYAMQSVWEVHLQGAEDLLRYAHARMISKVSDHCRKASAKRRVAKFEEFVELESHELSPDLRAMIKEFYENSVRSRGSCPDCGIPLVHAKRVRAGKCDRCQVRSTRGKQT